MTTSLDKELEALVKSYLKLERNPDHRNSIEKLRDAKDSKELRRLLGSRLAFGTAGIRGRMGPGFGQMNDLVVIQTAQGIASYIMELAAGSDSMPSIIIGNDARHNSSRFAQLCALAMLEKGMLVYFCDYVIPTPLVAFGVLLYRCSAGLMVTASHNPKQDNGIKVYLSNGAQIKTPHDSRIQEHIMRCQEPWPRAWQCELVRTSARPTSPVVTMAPTTPPQCSPPSSWPFASGQLRRCHGNLCKSYYSYIARLIGHMRQGNQQACIPIVYTPLHGVGHSYLARAFEIAGFDDAFPVEAQRKPDPDFSTLRLPPNPEEAGALDMAFETAKHCNATLIIANDPDSDRCAVALYDPKSSTGGGRRRILTGNELGSLLGWWAWHNSREPKPHYNSEDQEQQDDEITGKFESLPEPGNCYMVTTMVSSRFLASMARIEGFKFVETQTGFKNIANQCLEIQRADPKNRILFAYEEALGYMWCDGVIGEAGGPPLDKDGVSAAVQVAQLAAYVFSNYNRDLEAQLDWLYDRYGYHHSKTSYYLSYDPQKTAQIFDRIKKKEPKYFGTGNQFKVNRVRDLSSSGFMITYYVDRDITFTLRTSGTEPKIKFYAEIVLEPASPSDENKQPTSRGTIKDEARKRAISRLNALIGFATKELLKPEDFGLIPADPSQ